MTRLYYHHRCSHFLPPPHLPSHPSNTHIQIIMRRHMEVEGEAWEEDCGTPESPGFTLFQESGGTAMVNTGQGYQWMQWTGRDLLLSSPFLIAKERRREHFPKEQRAETLDNSRCFPSAYRGRGPSGFVSCGCSCLWAKWTTVDLTLDLSSLSLCLFLVLLSLPLC